MRDLPLNALRAFAMVYETGGVRAAARRLRIAHSAVSRHVAELEGWLGSTLIERRGARRGIAFTVHGERLGKAAVAGFRELEHVVASLRERRSARSVMIGTAPSFAGRWLLPRLPDLERAHPAIEVSVLVDRRLSDLETGGLDIAIRMGSAPPPGLRCEPLMDDALYPVMSPALWRRRGRPQKPADLVGLRRLPVRDPQATWVAWRRRHGPEALDVGSGPRLTSSDLVLRAATQGQGVALARHRLAVDDLNAGLLVRPLGGLSVRLRDAYWVVRAKHRSPPAVETVIAWLHSQVARHPDSAD